MTESKLSTEDFRVVYIEDDNDESYAYIFEISGSKFNETYRCELCRLEAYALYCCLKNLECYKGYKSDIKRLDSGEYVLNIKSVEGDILSLKGEELRIFRRIIVNDWASFEDK